MSTQYHTDGTKTRSHPKRNRPSSQWGPWRDVASPKPESHQAGFRPFTVIVRCPCGCGLYQARKVNATNYDSAIHTATQTPFPSDNHKHQPLELVMVLCGHCHEA